MEKCTFSLFQKSDSQFAFRFFRDGELIGERELSSKEIQAFIEEVEASYQQVSPDLAGLGGRLYGWLDGQTERWMSRVMENSPGLAVHIDVSAHQLRHLPWELLRVKDGFLCDNPDVPFTPVRYVNGRSRLNERANRPLRILFMACSPEGVEPVLDYEAEEALILQVCSRHPVELTVEESGSLSGLEEQISSFDPGYFDVLHLTGHASVHEDQPIFLMEDDRGFEYSATSGEIAQSFAGAWPRLIFLSGCKTGMAADRGNLPSLCESLVNAGAPAVLGWALPVGDHAANLAAAALYDYLSTGMRVDEAVARTRQALLRTGSGSWHLLRLYADTTPLSELVTRLREPGRQRLTVRKADMVFLEAGKVEVCPRELFVGRRRLIQRCLRALRSYQDDPGYAEGVLLHGMGGLGKSSVAVRLCERMSGYLRLVWVGRIDEIEFLRVINDKLENSEARKILNDGGMPLKMRLQIALRGPLAGAPILFVFDDFEQQNFDLAADNSRIKQDDFLKMP